MFPAHPGVRFKCDTAVNDQTDAGAFESDPDFSWSGWRDLLDASLRLAPAGFVASRLHSKFAPGEFVNSWVSPKPCPPSSIKKPLQLM